MKPRKSSKKIQEVDLVFGDGSKLTEKQKRTMDEAIAKHRAQRRKKAA